MTLFVDTAAFYALLDADDPRQTQATSVLAHAFSTRTRLVTSNYVWVESTALVQSRLGMEAAQALVRDLLPAVRVEWLTAADHEAAAHAMLTANRRRLSLVDCTSFQLMRSLGIETAFTFDRHFAEQGFKVVP